MSRFSKRLVVVITILSVSLLQAGLAGVAYFGRKASEGILQSEEERRAKLSAEIELAQERKVETAPPPPSRWRLLDNPDVSGILEFVQARGDASGVVFASVKAAQSSTAGKQSYQITGHGTPDQVCLFLEDLETQERLILVESGKVTPGSDSEILFELGLATYHLGGSR